MNFGRFPNKRIRAAVIWQSLTQEVNPVELPMASLIKGPTWWRNPILSLALTITEEKIPCRW